LLFYALFQVLAALVESQEQLHPIMLQHMSWIEQLTATDSPSGAAALDLNATASRDSEQQQHHRQHHQQHTGLSGHSSNCRQWPAAAPGGAAAAETGMAAPLTHAGPGYALRLLASATPADVQQALNMTTDDMFQWMRQLFTTLAALLELACRPAAGDGIEAAGEQAGSSIAARHNADTDAWEPDSCVDQQLLGSHRHQQQRWQQLAACSSDAAAPAAPEGCCAAAGCTANDPFPAAVAAARRQIESCIDRCIMLSLLVLLYNPVVGYTVMASNLATGERAVGSHQHWVMVSERE
jgi:hypothetical protein